MRNFVFGLLAMLLVPLAAYKVGYERATARYRAESTLATQQMSDALSRASDALSDTAAKLELVEQSDDDKLKEIEDEAAAVGATCHLPADRLRTLDAIR